MKFSSFSTSGSLRTSGHSGLQDHTSGLAAGIFPDVFDADTID